MNTRNTSDAWTYESLSKITKGYWIGNLASDDVNISGLTVITEQHETSNIVVVRSQTEKRGIPLNSLKSLLKISSVKYLMCTECTLDNVKDFMLPTLVVKELKDAVIDIGRASRLKMTGAVIGITGSAGKTTLTSMLSDVLKCYGSVVSTKLSANLPFGIAWNLSRINSTTEYSVIEMAIGNMQKNTALVKPTIAVFTNIGAAHLQYHQSTQLIAFKKSKIFSSMKPNSWAVLNRDMLHWDIVNHEAKKSNINVLTYGLSEKADIKLVDYSLNSGEVVAFYKDKTIEYAIQAHGQHMVLNSLACIAVIDLLNMDINKGLLSISNFQPVQGRGNLHNLLIDDKSITLIDESYNANPVSMEMSLILFKNYPLLSARRVLVLGDMLELGHDSLNYHLKLIPIIISSGAEYVYLIGDMMKQVYLELLGSSLNLQVFYFNTIEDLLLKFIEMSRINDLILVKSSNSIGLNKLVSKLCDLSK